MKNLCVSLVLIVVLMLIIGCRGSEPSPTPTRAPAATASPTPEPTATLTPTPSLTPSPSPTPSPTPLSPAAILEQAAEAYANADTVRMSGMMTMTVSSEGMIVEIPVLIEQAYQAPDRLWNVVSISFMGDQVQAETITIGEDRYTRDDPTARWIYEAGGSITSNQQGDLQKLLVFDRDLFTELTLVGTESIGDVNTYHIRGLLPFRDLAFSLGPLDEFPVADEERLVEVDYWIGTEDLLVRAATTSLYSTPEEEGTEVVLETVLRCYDYDEPLEIEAPPPEEVLNATIVASGDSLPASLGMIAFQSDRRGNADIYVMNANGTEFVNLTEHPAYDSSPTWSPDGQTLAFNSDRNGGYHIFVMNGDGSEVRQLTRGNMEYHGATWSPDGSHMVVTVDLDDAPNQYLRTLYVMDSSGGSETRLIAEDTDDYSAVWSPDGSRIAFTSRRHGKTEIYVMNADGTGQTRLTETAAYGWDSWWPAWSPDGQRIAFSSNRAGNPDLYIMNADGSGVVRLTYNDADDYTPTWSPDGEYIAFTSTRDGNREIYIIRVDGGALWRITNNPAEDRQPSWRP